MPDRANSTIPPVFLRQDDLLAGIQQLNGLTAALCRDLRTLIGSRGERLRPAAEQLVEELILFLDTTDGDPDLEDDGDAEEEPDGEPLLGATDGLNQEKAWRSDGWCAPETAAEPEDDPADDEPSLGSTASLDQGCWAFGTSDEREDEHDGGEPDEDGEPELGSFDRLINQRHAWKARNGAYWWGSSCNELDTADNEPSLGWTVDGLCGDSHDREADVQPA